MSVKRATLRQFLSRLCKIARAASCGRGLDAESCQAIVRSLERHLETMDDRQTEELVNEHLYEGEARG